MLMKYFLRALYIAFCFIVYSALANAEFTKNIIGKSQDWTVLKANPNDNTVCYAILYTHEHRGNQQPQEEKPYIMVHYFSEHKVRFSTYFGYTLLQEQPVHLSIDSTQYKISSMNEYAIAQSSEQDDQIISKLKSAKTLLIRGEGMNHSYSVDTYNVQGFDKAFEIMQEKCESNSNNSAFKTVVPEKESLKKLKEQ